MRPFDTITITIATLVVLASEPIAAQSLSYDSRLPGGPSSARVAAHGGTHERVRAERQTHDIADTPGKTTEPMGVIDCGNPPPASCSHATAQRPPGPTPGEVPVVPGTVTRRSTTYEFQVEDVTSNQYRYCFAAQGVACKAKYFNDFSRGLVFTWWDHDGNAPVNDIESIMLDSVNYTSVPPLTAVRRSPVLVSCDDAARTVVFNSQDTQNESVTFASTDQQSYVNFRDLLKIVSGLSRPDHPVSLHPSSSSFTFVFDLPNTTKNPDATPPETCP
jgi:hypothetical protein